MAIISSAESGLERRHERDPQDVGESPSSACRLAEHCVSRSPGSDCGKNTELGMLLAAGSKRNPTLIRSSFQPDTLPTLFSMDFCTGEGVLINKGASLTSLLDLGSCLAHESEHWKVE